ncbi:hypothetical protein [Thioalkalivibrio sp. ALgr1]|uniref:hypothetical protein n=1 Tax=Thioalkalivibrio sp. ALgr1 TaxID=748655 RepID=UPI00037B5336|nr:hypothetical protein [Thioalkalivibrio sp. ALgr1]
MEPVSVATAYASVVGLLGQFQASRGGSEQADFNEFLQWLVDSNHEEVKDLIESNTKTMIGIKALLNQNHDVLLRKLDALDSALSSFGSLIPGFSDISSGLYPGGGPLSEQAKHILSQFQNSGASKILELHTYDGVSLLYLGGQEQQMEIPDPRFLEDDLKTLVELGLLRHDLNGRGDNLYIFTRTASELVLSANL